MSTGSPAGSVEVAENPEEQRFEIRVDGALAGITAYRKKPGLIAFVHTEIDPLYEGRGLGSTLIGAALDASRADGLAVLPFCPFVDAYIKRHPEYVDLVPPNQRKAFGL